MNMFESQLYVSGGCGAMFDINVVAPEFKGLKIVKQHQIINEVINNFFWKKLIMLCCNRLVWWMFAGPQGGNQRYAWPSNTYESSTTVNCTVNDCAYSVYRNNI